MSNNITEEKGQQPMGDAAAVIQKKARQLVYDARYEVKGIIGNKKVDPVSQERMILQRIAKSTSSPAVKSMARQMVSKKRGAVKEEFVADIQETATDNVVKALFKVFVEGVETPQIENAYLEELASSADKKYKIRVTDTKTGNSYVRYATREKISQLRAQGLKVELTEYGEPREGEKKRGEDTARATGGGGKKSRKDYDGDGKIESSAKEHAGAVHNAIQRKKGLPADGKDTSDVKESLVGRQAEIDANHNNKIDSEDFKILRKKKNVKEDHVWTEAKTKQEKTSPTSGVDNYASGAIKLFPSEEDSAKTPSIRLSINSSFEAEGPILTEKAVSKAQQRFFGMVRATQKGEMEAPSSEVASAAKSMKKKDVKDFASTGHEGLPEKKKSKKDVKEAAESVPNKKEEDSRAISTYRNLLKNKLRAMGAKNPIVLGADDEKIMDLMTKDKVDPMHVMVSASYEPEGKVLGEEEYDRMKDRRQEVGGVSANADQKPARRGASGPKKKPHPDAHGEAMRRVRASVEKQYGKGSLM